MAPTVGLAIIARDEEKSLPGLLESLQVPGAAGGDQGQPIPAFDQVVLLDTGSTDGTVEVFKEWAGRQAWATSHDFGPWKVGHFEWVDDFAAARNRADELLDTEWTSWADCDDVIVGAQNLRALAERAPDEIAGYIAGYNYAQAPDGTCICYLKRERLVRRGGAGGWVSRVHESQALLGPTVEVGPDVVEWVHRKQTLDQAEGAASNDRNLKILRRWIEDEPENPFVLSYLGMEYGARGKHPTALKWFRRYLALAEGLTWSEHRAQVYRKLSVTYFALGQVQKAIGPAMEALALKPDWPDSALTLAEAYADMGEFDKAIHWADRVIEAGVPSTLLIINPLDYTAQPRLVKALALAELGRVDEAVMVAKEALELAPFNVELRRQAMRWQERAKREHAANTVHALGMLLINHDEQLKALALLEDCVPYFAADHAKIVQLRSMLRERLAFVRDPEGYAEHYTTGGSKPEDFLDDEQVDEVCGALPRCAFLLEGVREQAGLAEAAK